MRCGVVVFPGSNCDHDVYHVLKHVLDQEVLFLWHNETQLRGCELIVLPGGFSYGDYLRAGAMAAGSAIMPAIRRHAEAGGLVLGICNGFQILLETGLLPGAMRRNRSLRFECRDVYLRVERTDTPFTRLYRKGQVLRFPIAHGEGCFTDHEGALDGLENQGRIAMRYTDPAGLLDEAWNFNGSMRFIAAICNKPGNVFGLMPHPERCSEEILGNSEGLEFFAGAVGAAIGAQR